MTVADFLGTGFDKREGGAGWAVSPIVFVSTGAMGVALLESSNCSMPTSFTSLSKGAGSDVVFAPLQWTLVWWQCNSGQLLFLHGQLFLLGLWSWWLNRCCLLLQQGPLFLLSLFPCLIGISAGFLLEPGHDNCGISQLVSSLN